ncbi:membrane integrity-associated transporter subunit PqiC [Pelagovum pacificum]|uniref:ABC-type transport auxiliary lipoprotein component domain-containing protein n=1 Tax=Pelagovum pacificum TaxID=2588711 RepID=A0A5C5GEZ5_9RHOB|nr:ABC-type transport auxiliary lipoprotein family protein [Pelagovum pacificum]QQA43587.1 membrane integrity-associated transporter subunit PqiC [Pelagovum pacificum]TNY33278.1 hypothetical protein FHY64_08385 [Pelagovum pacificum]
MTLRITSICFAALTALGACGDNSQLYSVPPVPAAESERVQISYGTVEVRQVSLPDYASQPEIYVRGADGSLTASDDLLWADEPTRAMTLELSRYLAQSTGAQVAAEPWPFADRAQATVEVRVEEMLTEPDGMFRITGQYHVASDFTGGGKSGLFDVAAPLTASSAGGIAAARGRAVYELALLIARQGM